MNVEIANRLVQLRKEKGFSQESLAEQLGISRQAVSKWERAESSPDTSNLISLAKLYGVSLDELVNVDQEKFESVISINETESFSSTVDNEESDFEEDLEDTEGGFERNHIDLMGFLGPLITAIYLWIGIFHSLWHPGWLIFLLIPILNALANGIFKIVLFAIALYNREKS